MVPAAEVILHVHILVLYQGIYGQRIADNLKLRATDDWRVKMLELPKALPVLWMNPKNSCQPIIRQQILCYTWPKHRKQPSFCRVQPC